MDAASFFGASPPSSGKTAVSKTGSIKLEHQKQIKKPPKLQIPHQTKLPFTEKVNPSGGISTRNSSRTDAQTLFGSEKSGNHGDSALGSASSSGNQFHPDPKNVVSTSPQKSTLFPVSTIGKNSNTQSSLSMDTSNNIASFDLNKDKKNYPNTGTQLPLSSAAALFSSQPPTSGAVITAEVPSPNNGIKSAQRSSSDTNSFASSNATVNIQNKKLNEVKNTITSIKSQKQYPSSSSMISVTNSSTSASDLFNEPRISTAGTGSVATTAPSTNAPVSSMHREINATITKGMAKEKDAREIFSHEAPSSEKEILNTKRRTTSALELFSSSSSPLKTENEVTAPIAVDAKMHADDSSSVMSAKSSNVAPDGLISVDQSLLQSKKIPRNAARMNQSDVGPLKADSFTQPNTPNSLHSFKFPPSRSMETTSTAKQSITPTSTMLSNSQSPRTHIPASVFSEAKIDSKLHKNQIQVDPVLEKTYNIDNNDMKNSKNKLLNTIQTSASFESFKAKPNLSIDTKEYMEPDTSDVSSIPSLRSYKSGARKVRLSKGTPKRSKPLLPPPLNFPSLPKKPSVTTPKGTIPSSSSVTSDSNNLTKTKFKYPLPPTTKRRPRSRWSMSKTPTAATPASGSSSIQSQSQNQSQSKTAQNNQIGFGEIQIPKSVFVQNRSGDEMVTAPSVTSNATFSPDKSLRLLISEQPKAYLKSIEDATKDAQDLVKKALLDAEAKSKAKIEQKKKLEKAKETEEWMKSDFLITHPLPQKQNDTKPLSNQISSFTTTIATNIAPSTTIENREFSEQKKCTNGIIKETSSSEDNDYVMVPRSEADKNIPSSYIYSAQQTSENQKKSKQLRSQDEKNEINSHITKTTQKDSTTQQPSSHDETNVTTWERPVDTSDNDDEIDAMEPESTLPEGGDGDEWNMGDVGVADSNVSEKLDDALDHEGKVDVKEDGDKVVDNVEGTDNLIDEVGEDQLPEGWVEAFDPSSNKPFYYNEVENITTWIRPSVEIVENADDVDTNHVDDMVDKGNVKDNSEPPEYSDLSVNMDEGVVREENARVEDLVNDVDIKSIDKELNDKHLDQSEPQTMGEYDENIMTNDANDDNYDDNYDDNDGDNGDLPDGWVSAIDPASKGVYYYHEETNVTTWERPVDTSDNESTLPEEGDGDEWNMGNAGVADSNVSEKLDDALDHEGEVDVKGESWENRGVMQNDVSFHSEEPAAELPSSNAKDIVENVNSLPEGWKEMIDQDTKLPYYFNESKNISSWDRPDGTTEQISDLTNVDFNRADEDSKSGVSPSDRKSDLPEGWVEMFDDNAQLPYYFNQIENMTTWEKPVAADLIELNAMNADKNVVSNHSQLKNDAMPSTNDKGVDSGNTLKRHMQRPPCAIPSFGFGGRLCVMIPQPAVPLSGSKETSDEPVSWRKGDIALYRINELIENDDLCLPNTDAISFNCPLVSTAENDVLSHIECEAKKCHDAHLAIKSHDYGKILWELILIAARSKGSFRSKLGTKDPSGPESAILELLLANGNDDTDCLTSFNDKASSSESKGNEDIDAKACEERTLISMDEVQTLLLKGNREEATTKALDAKQYGLAILIANICGDRNLYQKVATCFAESLPAGSCLRTIAILSSGVLQVKTGAMVAASTFWDSFHPDDLQKTWKKHLATILSNRFGGWEILVLALGQCLFRLNNVQASHFCFLVGGCPVRRPDHPLARLVLLGCNHDNPMHAALLTQQGIESYKRTEAFEWARRQGNSNAVISALQPFKLQYASILADCGMETLALKYVESIKTCIGLTKTDGAKYANNSESTSSFIEVIEILDDRLHVSLGIPQNNTKEDIGITAKLGKLTNGLFRKEKEILQTATAEDSALLTENSDLQSGEYHIDTPLMPPKSQNIPLTSSSDSPTKVMPVTNVNAMPTDGISFPEMTQKKQPDLSAESQFIKPKKEEVTEDKKVAPTSPNKITQQKESKSAQKNNDAQSVKKEKGGLFQNTRNRFARMFNPDATVVNLEPDDGKPVYDEKLKRWIFPGDDPAELAKPLPPPPKIPLMMNKPESQQNDSNDALNPLDSLIRPPPRRVNSVKPPTARSRYPDAMASMGAVSSSGTSSKSKPSTGPKAPTAPPKFTVFKPSPSTEKDKK